MPHWAVDMDLHFWLELAAGMVAWRLIVFALIPFIMGEAVTITESFGYRFGGTAEICDILAAALLVAGLIEHRRERAEKAAQPAD